MLIEIPIATINANAYVSPLKDRLTQNQRSRLLSVLSALRSSNATLADGSLVEHEIDAVQWILEQQEAVVPE